VKPTVTITTAVVEMAHRVRCHTCAPDGLEPPGEALLPAAADTVARAHVQDHPGHEVTVTYEVEVSYSVQANTEEVTR
jgi:hypothetical protein